MWLNALAKLAVLDIITQQKQLLTLLTLLKKAFKL